MGEFVKVVNQACLGMEMTGLRKTKWSSWLKDGRVGCSR